MILLSHIFLIIGITFIALAVLGLLRMKDLRLRLQVASKASTLELIFCLPSVILSNPIPGTLTKALLTILFLFLTTHVAAQAIAKLSHEQKTERLKLKSDDLKEDLSKS